MHSKRDKKIQRRRINIRRDLEQKPGGTKKLIYSLAKSCNKKGKEATYAMTNKEEKLLIERDKIATRWRKYF